MRKSWDIFCRVIDNYGDIGVCWRLARQLADEQGQAVRLWVDDLSALAPLCPAVTVDRARQNIAGIALCQWPEIWLDSTPAEVVIEAFACELPEPYLEAMARQAIAPCWINLEYLSAESWVEDCHGLASPHPRLPLKKTFFFPGLTPRTGGLVRERDLFQRRAAAQCAEAGHALTINLFCYAGAPVAPLIEQCAAQNLPTRLNITAGKAMATVDACFSGKMPAQIGQLQLCPQPFLPQADFDNLLWAADINFVRGEDSFVRAQWAARPFVWHIYPQADDAHLDKLHAFLERYTADLPVSAANATRQMFLAWNTGREVALAWAAFLEQYPVLKAHARHWAAQLAEQPDLASQLRKLADKRV